MIQAPMAQQHHVSSNNYQAHHKCMYVEIKRLVCSSICQCLCPLFEISSQYSYTCTCSYNHIHVAAFKCDWSFLMVDRQCFPFTELLFALGTIYWSCMCNILNFRLLNGARSVAIEQAEWEQQRCKESHNKWLARFLYIHEVSLLHQQLAYMYPILAAISLSSI